MKNNPLYAYSYNKIIVDDNGVPIDFLILKVNKTFERISLLDNSKLENKRILEIIPDFNHWEFDWIETYGKVALTGQDTEFEVYLSNVKRWFFVYVYSTELYYFTSEFIDITHIKQCEQKHKEKESNFQTIFDSIDDFLFVINYRGNVLDVNNRVVETLGYQKEELLGRDIAIVHPKSERELVGEVMCQMLGGVTQKCTIPLQTKSGSIIPVETRIYKSNWDGEPAIFGVSKDMTKIIESEEKFEKAFRLSSSLMAITVEDTGEFLDINEAFVKATGYDRFETIGKTSNELNLFENNDIRNQLLDVFRLKGEVKNIELVINTKAGAKVHGLFSISKLFFNSRNCLLTTMSDITDIKKTEYELRKREKQLSNALDMAKLGPWEYDVEADHFCFNDHFYNMMKTSAENEGGYFMTVDQYSKRFLFPGDLKIIKDEIDCAIETTDSEITKILEHRVIFPTSETGYVSVLYFIVKDKFNRTLKIFGVNQDITERKQSEMALKNALNQAELANKSKSDFLANISHEIRTPLNSVIGFTDLLLRTKLDETQMRYAESAHLSGRNLLGIINTILDFSKIEAGKLDLEIVETNLDDLVSQTISSVKYQIESKGLELNVWIDSTLPRTLYFDPLRLKQVLINLLANAIKFTDKGSVSLSIRKIKCSTTDCSMRFSVIDTGIGISQDMLTKIFKPFEQGDSSTTRKHGGTGLGLTISYMLVDKMNSVLHVKSELNKGSEFFFVVTTRFK